MDLIARRSIAVAASVVAVDQLTKHAARGGLLDALGVVEPTTNPALSLGVVDAATGVEIALAAICVVVFGGWTLRLARRGRLGAWVPGVLVGGAVANLADRVAGGAVHDFLVTPWFVANLADLAVLAGVGGYWWALAHPPRQVRAFVPRSAVRG